LALVEGLIADDRLGTWLVEYAEPGGGGQWRWARGQQWHRQGGLLEPVVQPVGIHPEVRSPVRVHLGPGRRRIRHPLLRRRTGALLDGWEVDAGRARSGPRAWVLFCRRIMWRSGGLTGIVGRLRTCPARQRQLFRRRAIGAGEGRDGQQDREG